MACMSAFGTFSSSWAIMVASISTCPNSSDPMPNSRSRHLPGMWLFHAWKPYCMAMVISPYGPPSTSWSLRALHGVRLVRNGFELQILLVKEHAHSSIGETVAAMAAMHRVAHVSRGR